MMQSSEPTSVEVGTDSDSTLTQHEVLVPDFVNPLPKRKNSHNGFQPKCDSLEEYETISKTKKSRSFKCNLCTPSLSFSYQANLLVHANGHLKTSKYHCKLCGGFFARADRVTAHTKKCKKLTPGNVTKSKSSVSNDESLENVVVREDSSQRPDPKDGKLTHEPVDASEPRSHLEACLSGLTNHEFAAVLHIIPTFIKFYRQIKTTSPEFGLGLAIGNVFEKSDATVAESSCEKLVLESPTGKAQCSRRLVRSKINLLAYFYAFMDE